MIKLLSALLLLFAVSQAVASPLQLSCHNKRYGYDLFLGKENLHFLVISDAQGSSWQNLPEFSVHSGLACEKSDEIGLSFHCQSSKSTFSLQSTKSKSVFVISSPEKTTQQLVTCPIVEI